MFRLNVSDTPTHNHIQSFESLRLRDTATRHSERRERERRERERGPCFCSFTSSLQKRKTELTLLQTAVDIGTVAHEQTSSQGALLLLFLLLLRSLLRQQICLNQTKHAPLSGTGSPSALGYIGVRWHRLLRTEGSNLFFPRPSPS